MEKPKLPPFTSFLAAALILGGIGLAGLYLLFSFTLPTLAPRWLFFFLATITTSGLALPVIYFFHWRFPSPSPVTPGIIIRQAIWVGVYFDLLAWFQMGRFLSLPLALALAAGLAAIEFALRLAERSRFVASDEE
ncbi:MAG: hypothetical protein AB1453_16600 [Chloroflexota bacterium]